jgi:hypothetical protein
VVGDLNGDGVLDLAVANSGNNTVSVLLGTGDGTFGDARNFSAGIGPQSVATGDFDGDGVLDLVVTSGTVRVLRGNGDGMFRTTPVSYAVGSGPTSVALADFNGDGWPDLAVTNDGGGVSILDNDGVWNGPGPGPAPGGGRPPRGETVPAVFDGFAAEALVSRPALGTPFARPFQLRPDSPAPTNRATRPPAEQPAARAVRSAVVSRRGADDFFAHGEREAVDLWAAFGVATGRR